MPRGKTTKSIGVTIPIEIAQKLKDVSEKQNRSISNVVSGILKEWYNSVNNYTCMTE